MVHVAQPHANHDSNVMMTLFPLPLHNRGEIEAYLFHFLLSYTTARTARQRAFAAYPTT